MGEIIVVTSGKGGVGKTTTTANIGADFKAREKGTGDRYGSGSSESGCCHGT